MRAFQESSCWSKTSTLIPGTRDAGRLEKRLTWVEILVNGHCPYASQTAIRCRKHTGRSCCLGIRKKYGYEPAGTPYRALSYGKLESLHLEFVPDSMLTTQNINRIFDLGRLSIPSSS